MHEPLVEICALLREQRRLCQQRQYVLASKSDVAELGLGATIRIRWRKRLLSEAQHDERGVHIGLEAEILVNKFRELTVAADEPRLCIELKLGGGPLAVLAGDPFRIFDHEILPASRKAIFLLDPADTIRNFEQQELTDVWPDAGADGLATKQRIHSHFVIGSQGETMRETIQVGDRSRSQRMGVVLPKRHVDQ